MGYIEARTRDIDETDIGAYFAAGQQKSLLRFLTCGSVDDGKSTLIGRLLYDTSQVFDDQLAALQRDSRKHGTVGTELDLALLLDGLEAEREQGITIDVAWRFFATPRRKFIVADTPGHEQYTRNMATGASTADVAVMLVDARQGISRQTRRHTIIASLLGIRRIVLAVNKIDLVGFDRRVFDQVHVQYAAFTTGLGFGSVEAIPISARFGDNVTRRSQAMDWYDGPSLLEYLETVPVGNELVEKPFRFPVQHVIRPNSDFRGFAGTVASGRVARGDKVVLAKSGKPSQIKRIVVQGGDLEHAVAGQAVTLVLGDEIELSRGNMLVDASDRPHVADRLAANLVWFDEAPMLPGRPLLLRTETDQASASVTRLEYRIDINSFAHEAATSLEMNEIGRCEISLQSPIAFDNFAENRATGAFILIDRLTNATVGAGMILHPLRRNTNLVWQALDVDRSARAAIKQQRPAILWFTGLSGSGKSTIANLLEKKLHAAGRHTYVLDGDNIRHGLNRDLGFSKEDRAENIRRVAEVARLMAEAGLIVLVSFISPFRAERMMARELAGDGEFVEIFVDTPFEECARRDPKGLYARALKGEIADFTGLDSPYETPQNPEIHLSTLGKSPEEVVETIETWLRERDNAHQTYDSGGGI